MTTMRYGKIEPDTFMYTEESRVQKLLYLYGSLESDINLESTLDSFEAQNSEVFSELTGAELMEVISNLPSGSPYFQDSFSRKIYDRSSIPGIISGENYLRGESLPADKLLVATHRDETIIGIHARGTIISFAEKPKQISSFVQEGTHIAFEPFADFGGSMKDGLVVNFSTIPQHAPDPKLPSNIQQLARAARGGIVVNFGSVNSIGNFSQGGLFINCGYVHHMYRDQYTKHIDTTNAGPSLPSHVFATQAKISARTGYSYPQSRIRGEELTKFGASVKKHITQATNPAVAALHYDWNAFREELLDKISQLEEGLYK